MNDQILIPLKDLVTKDVSHDRLKYWIKLLEIRPQVTNHIALVTPDESSQIKTLASMVSQGIAPKAAAKKIKGDLSSTVTLPAKVQPSGEVAELKGLLLLFADEIKKSREENTSLVAKIDQLSSEVASLRSLLSPVAGSAPKPSTALMAQVKQEPTFEQSLREVQNWLRGVVSPFVEPFCGH